MKRDNSYLIGNTFAKGKGANKGSFKSGSVPWNKNKKGIHLSPSSEFKKGQEGINHLDVGSKTIRIGKKQIRRMWIKISEPNIWIEYAKYLWIQKNGEIPSGLIIHHINFDPLDDRIENLAIMTRKAHFEIHKVGALGRKKREENIIKRKRLQDARFTLLKGTNP